MERTLHCVYFVRKLNSFWTSLTNQYFSSSCGSVQFHCICDYLNTRLLVSDDILLPDKLIYNILARMDKMEVLENSINVINCNVQLGFKLKLGMFIFIWTN